MSFVRDAAYGLYGALRLARFDRAGLRWIDGSDAGAWRSFQALWLLIPAYVVLLLLVGSSRPLLPGGVLHRLAGESVGEVVELGAYLLAARQVLVLTGSTANFPAYVAAYNWASVVQVVLLILVYLLLATGLVPQALGSAIMTVVAVALLIYSGFIARTALDITIPAAAGFVLLDVIITVMVSGITDALVYAPG